LRIYRLIDILIALTTDDLFSQSITGTTEGARAHARAQAGTLVPAMPTIPASAAPESPLGIDRDQLTWVETLPGGGYATKILARGTRLRLTDVDGDACAHVVLFRAGQTYERLSVADTIKVLWNAYPSRGSLLLSDQGRVLASIVADSSVRHDTMTGASNRATNTARYGSGGVDGSSPAGRELLVVAAAKHGLEPRDIPASISFFKGVTVELDGTLRFDGSAGPGLAVDLVAEMPLVVLIANAVHPLDPRSEYRCTRLEVVAWRGAPTTPGDLRWTVSPEGERAFLNTADALEAEGCP
jgi:urea carboxylase-associated protein 2